MTEGSRATILKRLRDERRESVERAKSRLREQGAIQQQIRRAIQDQPRTVPEVAQLTGLPSDEVLWQITALKKYGAVAEAGMSDGYYRYQLSQLAAK